MSLQRLAIAVGITLLVIFGIYRFGFSKGWSERNVEMQAAIAKANEESRAAEQRLTTQINANATQLQEATHALDQKSSALDRAIRAGRVRFPAPSCVQASAGAAATAPDRDEARGEPNRQADTAADAERDTLAAIAAIVAQGDRNTAQLNACIDAYNEVREQLNGHH
jgi:prophage endopeptidase